MIALPQPGPDPIERFWDVGPGLRQWDVTSASFNIAIGARVTLLDSSNAALWPAYDIGDWDVTNLCVVAGWAASSPVPGAVLWDVRVNNQSVKRIQSSPSAGGIMELSPLRVLQLGPVRIQVIGFVAGPLAQTACRARVAGWWSVERGRDGA